MKNAIWISLLLLAGCIETKKSDNQIMCTEEFRTVSLVILDKNGDPVLNGQTCTLDIHGDTVLKNQIGFFPGSYIVLTDNEKNKVGLGSGSDPFQFFFKTDSLEASVLFKINRDACHINKVSGSDTIRFY